MSIKICASARGDRQLAYASTPRPRKDSDVLDRIWASNLHVWQHATTCDDNYEAKINISVVCGNLPEEEGLGGRLEEVDVVAVRVRAHEAHQNLIKSARRASGFAVSPLAGRFAAVLH